MIYNIIKDGIIFLNNFIEKENSLNLEMNSVKVLLKEFCENGLAIRTNDGVFFSFDQMVELSIYEKAVLDLPDTYPFVVRIDAEGDLHDPDFRFRWGFYSHFHGEKLELTRYGCFIFKNNTPEYILSSSQYKICNAMDIYNSSEIKSLSETLRCLKGLQGLKGDGGIEMVPILSDTIIDIPDKIGIKMEKDKEGLVVQPELPSLPIDQERFAKQITRSYQPKDIYTENIQDGSRRRVVFSNEQKSEIAKIKNTNHIKIDKIDDFINNPASYFDPDIVDLEYFSERVKELGFYKPKFYTFITPYKSQWFEGLLIEDLNGEQKKILIKNEQDLDNLYEKIKNCENDNGAEIILDGVTLPIGKARELYDRSEKRIRPKEKVKTTSTPDPEHENEKVLIIFENIEAIDFQIGVSQRSGFEHIYETPPNLASDVDLLPHQEEGVAWLQQLSQKFENSSVGALLADDMGLGKTLQILSFIEWLNSKRTCKRPYLVVAPVALLENWETEYRKFFPCGQMKIFSLYGTAGTPQLNNPSNFSQGLYLTTYETLRRRQRVFCAVDWSVVVLDEAQKIKTPGTLVTNASKALKADFRIAATGTPVENTLVDLWCLADFVMPGLLGSAKEFNRRYNKPGDGNILNIRSKGEEIRNCLGVFFKRRMKKDILSGLPEKHEEKVPHEMTPLQIESYNEALFRLSEHRAEQAKTQGFVLATLQRLRDISDHPYLGERNESFFELSTCDSLISLSAKLITTIDILNDIRKKQEKVIIFTPRRGVQLLLRRILLEKFNISPEYVSIINGDTPVGSIGRNMGQISRQDAVDAFQSRPGFQTIIMSPLAAGFGLNIAGANHVIHYTRHWNPAKENQATDRVYRIGQKKEVFVYYPLATGIGFRSFDEILDERLQMKIDLASQTLFPTEQVEVTPADLLGELEKEGVQTKNSVSRQVLQDEIDYMDPFLFEALVALLWEKQGFKTYLTPKSSDYGADVVAIKDSGGILFRVKQSLGSVKDTVIGEILKAKDNYQNQFKCKFSLFIITNGKFSEQTYSLAQNNDVGIYDREAFFSILDRISVTWQDIYQKEIQRMA